MISERNRVFDAILVQWRRRFPEISQQEALADLWGQGIKTADTFRAFNKRLADAEDDRHNVWKHPDNFSGWHIGWVEDWKPGVLKFFATRTWRGSMQQINGFTTPKILRVAIETHVIEKPNGYTMP